MTGFFGPAHMVKDGEEHLPTPVGEQCLMCGEDIAEADTGTVNSVGQITHYECMMRAVVGSVAHLRKECLCYGGTALDMPFGQSYREGAKAAVKLWEEQQ